MLNANTDKRLPPRLLVPDVRGEGKIILCVETNFPIPNGFNGFGQIGSSVNMCVCVCVCVSVCL